MVGIFNISLQLPWWQGLAIWPRSYNHTTKNKFVLKSRRLYQNPNLMMVFTNCSKVEIFNPQFSWIIVPFLLETAISQVSDCRPRILQSRSFLLHLPSTVVPIKAILQVNDLGMSFTFNDFIIIQRHQTCRDVILLQGQVPTMENLTLHHLLGNCLCQLELEELEGHWPLVQKVEELGSSFSMEITVL